MIMGALIDILGQRFGQLTVIARDGSDANKNVMWLCECDCGNKKTARSTHLRRGEVKSCGCKSAEWIAKARTTHGLSDKSNPLHKMYERERRIERVYGITVDRYYEMLSAQDNSCAICQKQFEIECGPPHIDHCHETTEVRGLLCQKCNTAIGMLGDDAENANRAYQYLSKEN